MYIFLLKTIKFEWIFAILIHNLSFDAMMDVVKVAFMIDRAKILKLAFMMDRAWVMS